MEYSPRFIRAMLDGHERNQARRHPTDALVAGFVHLAPEARRGLINEWASIARDELHDIFPPVGHRDDDMAEPPTGDYVRADGTKVVRDVASWLKVHGKGVPRRG